MIGGLFTRLGWSRDDLKWTIGMASAIILGLASLGSTVVDYGIPATWLPYLRLGALVMGIVSGKMATSSLFDSETVKRLTPVLLLCAMFSGMACGAQLAPKQPMAVADQVVIRLGELQQATIDAALAGKVKMADARLIVSWISGDANATPPVKGIIDVIKDGLAGWQGAVRDAWTRLRPLASGYPATLPYVAFLDVLIGGL